MSRGMTLMVNSQGGQRPVTWEGSVVLKQIPQQTDGKGEERGLCTQGSCLPYPSDITFLFILVTVMILLVALFLGTLIYFCVRRKRKQSRKCKSLDRSPDLTSPVACAWAPSTYFPWGCGVVYVCVYGWWIGGGGHWALFLFLPSGVAAGCLQPVPQCANLPAVCLAW